MDRTPAKSPFLELAGELRNKVYDFAFGDERPVLDVTFDGNENRRIRVFNPQDNANAVGALTAFSVNHQLRHESLTRLFSKKHFRVYEHGKSYRYAARTFLAAISAQGRKYIEHIELINPTPFCLADEPNRKSLNTLSSTMALLCSVKSLKFLHLDIDLAELFDGMGVRISLQESIDAVLAIDCINVNLGYHRKNRNAECERRSGLNERNSSNV
ncbi:uncharacterized protein BDZ99DRAFT_465700 [Mytilinidion resinicola]|uniref:Uncharacterized protein n=1 Tax=Mytilinidion resinicola TaxID=574789 RepID=A0A6A6YEC2_9PEZI|nr:uncharacterized protein BDZ99DRAFT_465700 [Mytilinidion resinicola]KAF2806949.1 hypothetical protein BDZ99DRAFT_465700 [Mytilinidion resinicola]